MAEAICEFRDCIVVRTTGAAALIEVEGVEVWIPFSEMIEGTEVNGEGCEGKLVIPEWMAVAEGLV